MKKIFLTIMLLGAITAQSQKINNNLAFEKGKKLEMTITVSSNVTSMGNTTIEAVIERSFDVEDLVNGNAVIEHKIKRIRFSMESMMGAESFDSENEDDRKGEIGKAMEKTLKNKYTMTLDATGKVIDIKKDDDNKTAAKDLNEEMIANILSQVGEGLQTPEVGESSDFKILPDRELTKGEAWTDSTTDRKTTYTVEDITATDIIISFVEEKKVEKKQEMMGNVLTIVSVENSTGTITLDIKSGLLKEKSATTDSTGTIDVMGNTMPVISNTTKKWTVR